MVSMDLLPESQPPHCPAIEEVEAPRAALEPATAAGQRPDSSGTVATVAGQPDSVGADVVTSAAGPAVAAAAAAATAAEEDEWRSERAFRATIFSVTSVAFSFVVTAVWCLR